MKEQTETPDQYTDQLPDERKKAINNLRKVIKENLPGGFEETMSYGMIGYVVPHSVYPAGYHCDPELPLPFMNIASQKNHIAIYHMGLYVDEQLMNWFLDEYKRQIPVKPDIGKSCIRFKNPERIPYDLVGELASRMMVDRWIELYESKIKR